MNPDKIPAALQLAFSAKLPVMMWGPPGIGKSSVVRQVAESTAIPRPVFDIRLALLDPTDLRGIPFYNPNSETAEWATASILPQDPESKAILFLDEINAAPPVIQAAAYQLVLDRRIGEYRVPEGVDIVAAGNREGDKGVTFKMPTPLLNRFIHMDFESNFNSWYTWAIKGAIHPSVVGFIKYKNDMLMKFDPKSASRGFATPRTWEFTSKLLIEAEKGGFEKRALREVVSGTIGEGAAAEFMAYLEVVKQLPDPTKVLTGEITKLKKIEISAQYSLLIALGQRLKVLFDEEGGKTMKHNSPEFKKWTTYGDNYFTFINANFDDEFVIMGTRDCFKTLELPMSKCKAYRGEFVDDLGDLVMEA